MAADRGPSPALRWTGAVVIGLAGSAGAAQALSRLVSGGDLQAAFAALPIAVAAIVATPFVTALLAAIALAAGRTARPAGARAEQPKSDARPAAATSADDPALHLLALLQQEGRFVDFIEENLAPYADDQVGAAVRSIHEGCRAALRERLELAPILPGEEGAEVTVQRGFDPAAVRVTGNVRGEPPYRGVLRHPGWRSTGTVKLPARAANHDPSILAPAEVEIP